MVTDKAEPFGELSGIQRVIFPGDPPSFETLLDEVCDRLTDTKQQGSLRRIHKLEQTLDTLEQELSEFLSANQPGKTQDT